MRVCCCCRASHDTDVKEEASGERVVVGVKPEAAGTVVDVIFTGISNQFSSVPANSCYTSIPWFRFICCYSSVCCFSISEEYYI